MGDATDVDQEVGEDLTALRGKIDQLQTQLAQARLRTHDFVAMLAHELRTPLGAILMWAHVLRTGRPGDREMALDAIETSAHEQSLLIGNLLDLTRAQAGRLKIERAPVDMAEIVPLAVKDLRAVAAAAETHLRVINDHGMLPVRGDAVRLRAMISSLVRSAMRVTLPGGTVDIVLTQGDGVACVSVGDCGPGFSGEEATEIFTPFLLAEDHSRRHPGALGLDLPLVSILAGLHHGTVTAGNRVDGQGRVLTLKIPSAAIVDAG